MRVKAQGFTEKTRPAQVSQGQTVPDLSRRRSPRRAHLTVSHIESHTARCTSCTAALDNHTGPVALGHMCPRGQALIGAAHVARLAARERRAA